MEGLMAINSPDDFEQSIAGIASLVLAPKSMPGRIINADKQNESEAWDEAGDKQRGDETIERYVDNIEAGIKTLTKS